MVDFRVQALRQSMVHRGTRAAEAAPSQNASCAALPIDIVLYIIIIVGTSVIKQ